MLTLCGCTHTIETEPALARRCFPQGSARPWWAQLCSGAGGSSDVWYWTDELVSGICPFNAPAVFCLSLKWMLLGSITGEWYKSDKTRTNGKYKKIAGTIQKDSFSRVQSFNLFQEKWLIHLSNSHSDPFHVQMVDKGRLLGLQVIERVLLRAMCCRTAGSDVLENEKVSPHFYYVVLPN